MRLFRISIWEPSMHFSFLFFNETFPSGCSKASRERFCEVVSQALRSCGFILRKSGISCSKAKQCKRRCNYCLAMSSIQALSTKCWMSVIGNKIIRAKWNYTQWTDNFTPTTGRQAIAIMPPAWMQNEISYVEQISEGW